MRRMWPLWAASRALARRRTAVSWIVPFCSSGRRSRRVLCFLVGRLPSGGEKAIVKLESEAGNALGMWKVGIEAVRPELHAACGKGLNLLALRQRRAQNLPERFFANHFCPVALDALGALGEDALVPAVA